MAYLEFKRDHDPDGLDQARVDAALGLFWLERARTAPLAETLRRHLADEAEYVAAIQSGASGRPPERRKNA